MKNRKSIITIALLAGLALGSISAYAITSIDLTQMDVRKSATGDTVDVTFYTTGGSNSVVTRKGSNRYVVLLPNTTPVGSVVPSLGGVKDLVTSVDVKHVDDGIGGYTKVTFDTAKPINIKTYSKKSTTVPVSNNYKSVVAQTSKLPVQTVQNVNTQTPKTAVQPSKPAQTQTPAKSQQAVPKTSVKPQSVENKSQSKQSAKATEKTNLVKPNPKPIETKTVESASKPISEPQTAKYVPKQKFDAKGKRIIDLEPRISHEIIKEKSRKFAFPSFEEKEEATTVEQPKINSTAETKPNTIPVAKVGMFEQIKKSCADNKGLFALFGLLALLFASVSSRAKKSQMVTLSGVKDTTKSHSDMYDEIVNNIELSWQEKYKMYSRNSKQLSNNKDNFKAMSYVADMSGKKANISSTSLVDKKISKVVSKSLPTINNREEVDEVKEKIIPTAQKIKQIPKLKGFANRLNLQEKQQSLIEDDKMLYSERNDNLHRLNITVRPIATNPIKKVSKPIENFDTNAIMDIGNKYLQQYKGRLKMSEETQNYLTSSLAEYLSVLDGASQTDVVKKISTPKASLRSLSRSRVSNPISQNRFTPSINGGMIVKSGHNIDGEKGFYLVNMDGVSALVGKNKGNSYILKKFDHIVDSTLQVRADGDDVYMVKAGRYKCLVDVAGDKMGTLIEI